MPLILLLNSVGNQAGKYIAVLPTDPMIAYYDLTTKYDANGNAWTSGNSYFKNMKTNAYDLVYVNTVAPTVTGGYLTMNASLKMPAMQIGASGVTITFRLKYTTVTANSTNNIWNPIRIGSSTTPENYIFLSTNSTQANLQTYINSGYGSPSNIYISKIVDVAQYVCVRFTATNMITVTDSSATTIGNTSATNSLSNLTSNLSSYFMTSTPAASSNWSATAWIGNLIGAANTTATNNFIEFSANTCFSISRIHVYNKSLSSAEVQTDYQLAY